MAYVTTGRLSPASPPPSAPGTWIPVSSVNSPPGDKSVVLFFVHFVLSYSLSECANRVQ